MQRLSNASLSRVTGALLPPAARPAPGILHLGIGAFHRAHQALLTEDALAVRPGAWGIVGVSLRRPDIRDALAPQDWLYTAVERDGAREDLRVVGVLRDVLVAPEDPAAVVRAVAAPETRIVSLTVTEKGYTRDGATGALLADHPDIRHDLESPDRPRSTIGVLVRGLEARRRAGAPPPTVMSCDNLPENGPALARLVSEFAALVDDGLAAWIEANVAFPASMVDRIVPATTADDTAHVAARLGLEDRAPVVFEPFLQWVIEDRFSSDRPAWEEAGAKLVTDVRPFEHMKLRLLNGAHSALAYLGYLSGHETMDAAVGDDALRRYAEGVMAESAETLEAPPGMDLAAYRAALIRRFANPALKHRTWQVAMDGTQKLPQRLLAPIRDRLAAGQSIDHLALAVAGWMRYVTGRDEQGRPIEVSDPLADTLRTVTETAGADPDAVARALLELREVFDARLANDPAFTGPVMAALRALYAHGAKGTAARVAAGAGRPSA